MKKLVGILGLIAITSISLIAQPEGRGEQLEAIRAAYITQQMSLTPEEAQQFWPIHNQMNEELTAIRNQQKEIFESHRGDRRFENVSETELLAEMQRLMELEQQMLTIRKKYHEKFLEVLSPQKVAMLYRAEEEFKRELLRRVRGREEGLRRGRGQ